MKKITMYLKDVPRGYYNVLIEQSYCLCPNKVYMINQLNSTEYGETNFSTVKYMFRIPTKNQTYETLITEQNYEGILRDVSFSLDDIRITSIYEYIFGKYTIRVFVEDNEIVATGPEECKEWQYEFQKYHV